MRDVLPAEIPLWERLEHEARHLARVFGFREIRPPLLEQTTLFIRSVGEVTDIVEKEMFTVPRGDADKGEGSLTLRPEATAGIARAYVEAGFAKTAPLQKLFTVGPMFRYEKPQKGRERQFTQFDCECIGSLDPRLDAELIHMAAQFFERLGITGIEVRLNSLGDGDDRDRFREAVRAYVAPQLGERCELCRSRFERNVLRVLDCKNPQCVELNRGAPKLLDFLSAANREHFDAVRRALEAVGRSTVVDPGIVRGLDYYTRTIFELHYPKLGARSALCGGGRYDHLVRDLGGPDLPAVGFAIGFTGALIVLQESGLASSIQAPPVDVYVVAASPGLEADVMALAQLLRDGGLSAIFDVEGRSVKSQFKAANTAGHPLVAVLGEDEKRAQCVQLKDMRSSVQERVALAELTRKARTLLGRG
ncbi:MAG: histidine--tRNA ligase [Planctomycetes bacterium]|nr:histidine--tRNA ligase [Planctomycetota bacterium]